MDSFWMQFRLSKVINSYFTEKKLLPVFKRYAWEIEEQKVEEAKVPGWGDWAFPEHLKSLFSCQGRNQFRIGFNLCKWRSQRKNKNEDLVISFTFTCCRLMALWPKVLLQKRKSLEWRRWGRVCVRETQKALCKTIPYLPCHSVFY